MGEVRTEVKTFVVDYKCEKCGHEMKQEDIVYATYPPRYPHICHNCGHRETLDRAYPYVDYKELNENA